ncbi:MAG: 30S ribosomal protein S16 [Candidatus Lindowbacteria bacterium]|nr:30S ribosomal protein S16 [Candidatus Lindowbacteria bacterium]
MSVKIRMKRMGTKRRPTYRVVVADTASPRDGKNIEVLGNYNPMVIPHEINLKLDRVDHWLAQGALPSTTVKGLIRNARKAETSANA